MASKQCIICGSTDGEMNLVGEKGLKTLIKSCSTKNETDLKKTLSDHEERKVPVHVHHECRKKLNDLRQKQKPVAPDPKRLRSSIEAAFDWKVCCFLCSKPVLRHKERVHQVQTLPLHNNIIECAKERSDTWGDAVLTRLGTSNDLVAEEAVYHNACMADFKLNKVERSAPGRPEDTSMTNAFQNICEWLENTSESEVYSTRELYDKMIEDNNGVGYCMKTFRSKLKTRYEHHVYFVQSSGCKGELVCFKDMADYILRKLKEKGPATRESVIKAAAQIV